MADTLALRERERLKQDFSLEEVRRADAKIKQKDAERRSGNKRDPVVFPLDRSALSVSVAPSQKMFVSYSFASFSRPEYTSGARDARALSHAPLVPESVRANLSRAYSR